MRRLTPGPFQTVLRAVMGGLIALSLALVPAGVAHAAPVAASAMIVMSPDGPCPHHAGQEPSAPAKPAETMSFMAVCCHALSVAMPLAQGDRQVPFRTGLALVFGSDPPAVGFAPPAPEEPPRSQRI